MNATEENTEVRDTNCNGLQKVPLEVLPERVKKMLINASVAFSVTIEIPFICLLSLLSSLVGRALRINIKESWQEAANLWIAIIAKSGVGKTPCMQEFFRTLYILEHNAKLAYDKLHKDYEEAMNARKLKSGKDSATTVDLPEEPHRKQTIVNDATIEVIGEILSVNPKGVHYMVDELSGFMFDMDKYTKSKGGAKSRYLSSHSSGSWTIDRKSGGSISIPHACVGICGGIQPGMMDKAFNIKGNRDIDSGFIPRFLFVFAEQDKPAYWSDCSFSEESKDLLSKITHNLYRLEVSENDQNSIVKVTDEAISLYTTWYNKIADEAHTAFNGSWLRKLQSHALRICLLLHCLEIYSDDCADIKLEDDCHSFVTEDTMRKALILTDWFKSHQKYCWERFMADGADEHDEIEYGFMKAIAELATINGYDWTITNNDLFKNVKIYLERSDIKSNVLGKVATNLGLATCHINRERGRRITKDIVIRFREAVGAVGDVWDPANRDDFDDI